MVNKLEYEQIDIDKKEVIESGKWYAFAGFNLLETKKQLGVFKKQLSYTDTFRLLIVSEGIIGRPDIEEITKERFAHRIVQKEFDKEAIIQYIGEKVSEAANKKNAAEAYEYLEQFFALEA